MTGRPSVRALGTTLGSCDDNNTLMGVRYVGRSECNCRLPVPSHQTYLNGRPTFNTMPMAPLAIIATINIAIATHRLRREP